MDKSRDIPAIKLGSGQFVVEDKGKRTVQPPAADEVSLDFVDANVGEIAQSVFGDILNKSFIVDGKIDQKLTLRTSGPIKKSAVLAILETALSSAGLGLVQQGGVYRVTSQAALTKRSAGVASRAGGQGGYSVLAVPLAYISPTQMAKILEPLAPEKAILRADDARSLLLLLASGPDMQALLETIETFDVNPYKSMSFGYFKLVNSKAADVVKDLKEIVKAHENQVGLVAPQLVPIARINSILVIAGKPSVMRMMEGWITRLDNAKEGVRRELYTYRLSNRKAKEIAPLLSSLFANSEAGGAIAPLSKETAPDLPDTSVSRLGQAAADGSKSLPALAPDRQPSRNSGPDSGPSLTGLGSTGAGLPADASTQRGPGRDGGSVSAQLSEDIRIVADDDNNTLLIRATAKDYKLISAAIQKLDVVPPLVLVEVTIAEVTLNDDLKFGIEWFFQKKQQSATFSSIDSGRVLSKFPGFSYFFNAADIKVALNAVSEITTVKIVSSPKVMVVENKTATLQIGDQVPVITSTSQSVSAGDAPVIQTVRYLDTGVILKVTPQVNARGLITMDINQEVSNVSPGVSSTSASASGSPTIQQRRISSSIAIQTGESVVLGGLIRDSRSNGSTEIPVISKVPSLGDLFKSRDDKKERTELLVVITPRIVWDRSDVREVTDELKSQLKGLRP